MDNESQPGQQGTDAGIETGFRESTAGKSRQAEQDHRRFLSRGGFWWTVSPLVLTSALVALMFFFSGLLGLENFNWKDIHRAVVHRAMNRAEKPAGGDGQGAAGTVQSSGMKGAGDTSTTGTSRSPGRNIRLHPYTVEIITRFIWAISVVALIFTSLLAGFLSLRSLHRCAWLHGRRWRILLSALGAGFAAVHLIDWQLGGIRNVPDISGGAPARQLLEAIAGTAISQQTQTAYNPPLSPETRKWVEGERNRLPGGVPNVFVIIAIETRIIVAAIALVTLGAGAIIWRMIREAEKGRDPERFKRLIGELNTLTRLATTALVIGVAEVYLLYDLASLHVEASLAHDVRQFAWGTALAAGIIYSGILATVFLPVLSVQRECGNVVIPAVAEPATDETGSDNERNRKEAGLDLGAVPFAMKIVTLLTPIFTAFLSGLFNVLNNMIQP